MTVVTALDSMLSKMRHLPTVIYSDLGTEFTNRAMARFVESKGIVHIFAAQSGHAQIVERFIQSMRRILRAYRIEHNTFEFVSKLGELVGVYNARVHSTTGYAPNDVNEYTAGFAADNMYKDWRERRVRPFKFRVGDGVRISTAKSPFFKHDHSYSKEVFTISARSRSDALNVYKVSGCNAQELTGSFYEGELVYIPNHQNRLYLIDKFLDEKIVDGARYVYVSFQNYPNNKDCNLWLKKSDVQDV